MIGIGGAGMSAVARILLDHGVAVSGSDARDSAELRALEGRGAVVRVGHDAAALEALGAPPEIVVISKAAIPVDNPEMAAARAAGIPVVTRSQVLGHLARTGRSIMVCGTHGKTSTTSMLIAGMIAAGADPSFAVGGTVLQFGTNARGGTDPVFVAEADESDGSLMHYQPDVVILTNAEPDHLDHFGTAEAYFEVFDTFLARIPSTGALVVCLDDAGAVERARRAAAAGVRLLGYRTATGPGTDLPVAGELTGIVVDSDGTRAELTLDGRPRGQLHVGTPGEHMALNALAALLAAREVGAEAGVDVDGFLSGLSGFGGVGRRFEPKGTVEVDGGLVRVYDDYAHHPTEVTAVLGAGREIVAAEGGRLVAVFQPHLYSRTRIFAEEFGRALSLADEVVVLDVYGAREQPEPGVDGGLIARHVSAAFHNAPQHDAAHQHVPVHSVPVHHVPDLDAALATVRDIARPGDVIFTLGAGDITTLGPRIVAGLAGPQRVQDKG
ncbi:UDP-N-acetylmuramate--L-alanine ligase [Rhodococcus sp. IEGM 1408]|uniref:UDP-N-acetylmuramate--L-alanine ligase n=1 Tax=Rhodococcus sp. IEGM 1408 TaxID=3082220 RepID=UPI0029555532|nr:UDP-N-acetylmuramate--L-alanine ligase [Rhodococcus sp. IEGM 1408]MDV8001847.1 UDP-N-acetylmuramate--L-alanine ligase [Rhodococcus sp. IEGM 1408]